MRLIYANYHVDQIQTKTSLMQSYPRQGGETVNIKQFERSKMLLKFILDLWYVCVLYYLSV